MHVVHQPKEFGGRGKAECFALQQEKRVTKNVFNAKEFGHGRNRGRETHDLQARNRFKATLETRQEGVHFLGNRNQGKPPREPVKGNPLVPLLPHPIKIDWLL